MAELTFLSLIFGVCILCSFVKNSFYRSHFQNMGGLWLWEH